MIGIITFLHDAELEDQVIEQLTRGFQEDVTIEFRALDESSLNRYLENFSTNQARTILVHDLSKLPKSTSTIILSRSDLVTIQISEAMGGDEIGLNRYIERSIRRTEATEELSLQPTIHSNLAVVTGSTGGSGVSTITLNLAVEIAKRVEVCLVDAHPFRKDLAFLLGGKRDRQVTNIRSGLQISSGELSKNRKNLVDLGPLIDLKSAVSDRRKPAREFIEFLESAREIIFVMQPDNNHMFELDNILELIESKRCRARPIFILNQLSNSSRERSIFKRFTARVGKYDCVQIPYDRASMDLAKAQYCSLLDVAPRSKMRKAICQVADRLIE
jgi:Flp pilus assembly CpaE family ATPase